MFRACGTRSESRTRYSPAVSASFTIAHPFQTHGTSLARKSRTVLRNRK
jgi:hypothetical protein